MISKKKKKVRLFTFCFLNSKDEILKTKLKPREVEGET